MVTIGGICNADAVAEFVPSVAMKKF